MSMNRNTSVTMTPPPVSLPAPSVHRTRAAIASSMALLVLASSILLGPAAAPAAASTPSTATLAAPTAAASATAGPESGPQLTAEAWRLAIGQAVVNEGATRLGAPYVYSAGGPHAFDCSGFVRWSWLQLGVVLPHNSVAMWSMVERIPLDQLQPGDLVFDSVGGPPSHVSIYVGDGVMLHAPNSRGSVRYDPVGWWTGATVTAGRVRV